LVKCSCDIVAIFELLYKSTSKPNMLHYTCNVRACNATPTTASICYHLKISSLAILLRTFWYYLIQFDSYKSLRLLWFILSLNYFELLTFSKVDLVSSNCFVWLKDGERLVTVFVCWGKIRVGPQGSEFGLLGGLGLLYGEYMCPLGTYICRVCLSIASSLGSVVHTCL